MAARACVVAAMAAILLGGTATAWSQAGAPAQVQSAAADSPALQQVRRYLEIARSPGDDAASLKALLEISVPPGPPPDAWTQFRPVWRRLQPHSFEGVSATQADIVAYDPEEANWIRLAFTVEAAAPHRVAGIRITPAARPADVPAPTLQPAALNAAVRARAEAETAADSFAGVVLIARHGRPVFQGAWGLADRAARIPNSLATQFRFGSMGKMFTAVAILQLAQAGRLDLKAPIGRYLPDYPNPEIARKVTLDQLLTHTGGTGDIFTPEFITHRLELKDPKDYVALFGPRAPLFEPGSRQQYSNYGFMLLGRIVEAASGESYDDYIAAHIFAPAGMTSTGNLAETVRLPRRSVSYMGPPGHVERADDTLPWRGTPAGGGYSTAGDMLRFANALLAHRLLDAAHLRLLTEGGVPGPDGKLIRYDFGGRTPEGRRFLGHSGGAPGMNGDLRIFPDTGDTVVVLANRDPPAAQGMANFITDRLP